MYQCLFSIWCNLGFNFLGKYRLGRKLFLPFTIFSNIFKGGCILIWHTFKKMSNHQKEMKAMDLQHVCKDSHVLSLALDVTLCVAILNTDMFYTEWRKDKTVKGCNSFFENDCHLTFLLKIVCLYQEMGREYINIQKNCERWSQKSYHMI